MSIIAVYRDVPKPPVDFTEFDFAALPIDPRITFTRASAGTYFDADGVMQTAAINEPRIDHDPVTGEVRGLLVEGQRTNSLLNSATLATQSVTVTAVAQTLSFYGPGTVTLSGASTAGPLVGTGTNERVSLTFTPTAGTLTLTVSGSVTNAQLETGPTSTTSFPTSYIPTEGTAMTRAADVAAVNDLNSIRYNAAEGVIFAEAYAPSHITTTAILFEIDDGVPGGANSAWVLRGGHYAGGAGGRVSASIQQSAASGAHVGINGPDIFGARYKAALVPFANPVFVVDGEIFPWSFGPIGVLVPNRSVLRIGQRNGDLSANTTIRRLRYYPRRLSDAELQALTS